MTLPFSPTYPRWMPDPQGYAVDQERYRHDEALAFFGEYVMFILMWRLDDFENGLVGRCQDCFLAYGKTAEVYGQPSKEKCPTCFGTTFEGGYKARIVRTSLWDFNEDVEVENRRGEVRIQSASVQTVSDFRLRNHDYIFRGDGSRWMVQSISTNHLRTGFKTPNKVDTPLAWNFAEVMRQEETSVAFMIPPDEDTLLTLDDPFQRYPVDWSPIEEINGPLIPGQPYAKQVGSLARSEARGLVAQATGG